MKQLKHILLLAGIISLASCSFLDMEPQDFLAPSQYYKTEADLETALTGVYSTLHDGALYKNYMLGRLGLDADLGYDNRDGDVGTSSQYLTAASDVKVEGFWQSLYKGINNANRLLAEVDNPDIDIAQTRRDEIKGEALFLRSYYYFLLVSSFGDVPLILIPKEKATKEELNIPRTPSKKVYEQIIGDMETATDLVPKLDVLGYGGRVSESAVWGILARVHLYMAGEPLKETSHYEDARDCALKVMGLGFHELNPDFQQIFKNYAQDLYDIKESIWEVEFYGNGSGLYATLGGYVGGNNGIRNSTDTNNSIGYTYDYINATQYAYKVYKDGDLRRDFTIAPFKYNWGTKVEEGQEVPKTYWKSTELFNRNCGKFRREFETLLPKHRSYTPTNFPLLRYADVLLMYAEAENEVNQGPTSEAYAAVNQVVRRGYGKPVNTPDGSVDWSGMDYTEFREEIQRERARELAYESLRKGDLIRWGIFLTQMKDCLADANKAPSFGNLKHAKATFGNVTARDVLWPIPSYEMALNTNLKQNPGW